MDSSSRRRLIVGASGLTFLSGCLETGSEASDDQPSSNCDQIENVITMKDGFEFDPTEIHISVGDSVCWVNNSSLLHSVTAESDSIPSGAEYFASGGSRELLANMFYPVVGRVEPGETYVNEFNVPGRYAYYSIPHKSSGMEGEVVVSE